MSGLLTLKGGKAAIAKGKRSKFEGKKSSGELRRLRISTRWTTKVSGPTDLGGIVNKFAPDKAYKFIASGQVHFYKSFVVHRVVRTKNSYLRRQVPRRSQAHVNLTIVSQACQLNKSHPTPTETEQRVFFVGNEPLGSARALSSPDLRGSFQAPYPEKKCNLNQN